MAVSHRKELYRIINRLLALPQVEGENPCDEYVEILSDTLDADAFAILSVRTGEGVGHILSGAELSTPRDEWTGRLELPLLARHANKTLDGSTVACKGTFEDDPFLKKERVRSMLLRGAGGGKECLLTVAFRRESRPFTTSERERFAAVAGVINLLSFLSGSVLLPQGARDRLTGLGLFRDFHQALARELSRARRSGGTLTMGIMAIEPMAQVPREKAILDVARTMGGRLRDFDTLTRYGPGELAFILPDLGSPLGVKVLERIVGDVLSSLAGKGVAPTIYLGLSGYPEEGTSVERLIELAEAAMNRAREESASGVHRWEE